MCTNNFLTIIFAINYLLTLWIVDFSYQRKLLISATFSLSFNLHLAYHLFIPWNNLKAYLEIFSNNGRLNRNIILWINCMQKCLNLCCKFFFSRDNLRQVPIVYRLIDAMIIGYFKYYSLHILKSKFWPHVHYCERYVTKDDEGSRSVLSSINVFFFSIRYIF